MIFRDATEPGRRLSAKSFMFTITIVCLSTVSTLPAQAQDTFQDKLNQAENQYKEEKTLEERQLMQVEKLGSCMDKAFSEALRPGSSGKLESANQVAEKVLKISELYEMKDTLEGKPFPNNEYYENIREHIGKPFISSVREGKIDASTAGEIVQGWSDCLGLP